MSPSFGYEGGGRLIAGGQWAWGCATARSPSLFLSQVPGTGRESREPRAAIRGDRHVDRRRDCVRTLAEIIEPSAARTSGEREPRHDSGWLAPRYRARRKSPSPRTEVHLGHVTARGSNYRETTPSSFPTHPLSLSLSPSALSRRDRIFAAPIYAPDYFPALVFSR